MATLRLRLRHAGGVVTLTVDKAASLEALISSAAAATGSSIKRLLSGFPPKPLNTLAGLRDGDSLTVEANESEETPLPPTQPAPQPAPASTPSQPLECVPLGAGGVLARRVVASDNSCLFAAVALLILRDREQKAALRELCASAVAADEDTFSDAFLGRSRAEYLEWIRNEQHWGGAIELSILATHFGLELHAADVSTCHIYRYGEGRGYATKAFLLYDGLHYDAVVAAASMELEDFDETTFDVADSASDDALARLVAAHHAVHAYTDTGSFSIRCLTCRVGLKGEKEAVAHARETGHQSFGEYA